jgi:hypothetical protein
MSGSSKVRLRSWEGRVIQGESARHTMSDCFYLKSLKTLTGALASPSQISTLALVRLSLGHSQRSL